MGVAARLKDLVRRFAVTMFGILEILGLPRMSEKKEGARGDKG
jgi:hypothetical protein